MNWRSDALSHRGLEGARRCCRRPRRYKMLHGSTESMPMTPAASVAAAERRSSSRCAVAVADADGSDRHHAAQEQVHARAGRAARSRGRRRGATRIPDHQRPADCRLPRARGNSLVAVAPRALNHAVFEYSFTPVNLKEINAFALPGGPMFVNRGMFDAAQSEGEVVGVMAHELAHVLLRHGTANATKAQNFQIGADRRRHRRRDHRRRRGPGDFAGLPVRPWRLADEVQPRIREAGRPARRADDGAGGLRPA